MKRSILVVEDDAFTSELLTNCLANEGYDVEAAYSGKSMFHILDKKDIHLILLDLNLPDSDGLALARQLRTRSTTPIIVLTSRDKNENCLAALDIGADDFLTKPCELKELLLRIRNILLRTNGAGNGTGKDQIIEFGGWALSVSKGTLTSPEGDDVVLARIEFDLLAALLKAPDRVLTRSYLLDAVSRSEESGAERMIDVLISRLRKRLEDDPKKPDFIITAPGRGYKFRMPQTLN